MKGTMHGIIKAKDAPGLEYREDLPIPQITDDEVLIKVHATAICGSDHAIYAWTPFYSEQMIPVLPIVVGHETGGEIVEIGKNVKGYNIGDRISVESHLPCDECYQCKTGKRHICNNQKTFGITIPGAFAEYAPVPAKCIVKLPDDISYEMAAMLEPMGAGIHGVEVADVEGKNVLVSGCGPIGLMAVGACRVHGAKQIIVCDLLDNKLELAKKMGADVVLNSGRDDIRAKVLELTDGNGADAAIDITGNGKAIVTGLKSLRKGGIFVSVGLPNGEIPIDLAHDIAYREIVYTGVSGRLMFETWDDCMNIMQDPRFDIKNAMGQVFKMKDFEKAFEATRNGEPGKMILIP